MSTSVQVASATDMPYHGGVVSLMQFCKNLLLLRCFFRYHLAISDGIAAMRRAMMGVAVRVGVQAIYTCADS